MPSATQTAPVSKKGLWAGRIMSTLVILFLAFDGVFKFVKPAPPPVVETMAHVGWSLSLAPVLGTVLLVCTALYAIPITSVLGAILLTGYLGGALAATNPETLVVPRPMEHSDRMRQQVRHRFQRFHGALWASRQIDDKGLGSNGSRPARQHCRGRLLQALPAHLFGKSGHDPVSHRLGRFRRVVPRPDPRSARRQENVHASGIRHRAQLLADICGIIGDVQRRGDFPPQPAA